MYAVLLCAATVNESAKFPIVLIRSAPSRIWGSDVRQQINQINYLINKKKNNIYSFRD